MLEKDNLEGKIDPVLTQSDDCPPTRAPDAVKDDVVNQFRALLEVSEDAIITKDLENCITGWSSGAERLYGYAASEVMGKPITLLFPSVRLPEADEILRKIRRGESVRRFETVRVNREGKFVDVTLTITPVRSSEGAITGALTIAHDAREQKQSERELRVLREGEENREFLLETARRVALDILASQTGVEALSHIAEAARSLAGARYAALGVARPHGEGLMEFVTVGLSPEEEARIGPRPFGVGILGLLLQRTEPLRINRLSDHPASAGFPPNHPPMASFLGVPIRQGEVVIGSLYLTNKIQGAEFSEADEVAVQALGAYAAVAIHNLQMLLRQRALVSGLISAQEEERRAVAYDLHDGLTQYIMAAHAHLEAFAHAHQGGKVERSLREMEQGRKYVKEAVLESRRLVNGLRSLALDDLGLSGALEQLIMEEKARSHWDEANFIHNIEGKRFDRSVEVAAYRVAQEALTNARKHARTRQVRLMLLLEMSPGSAHSHLTLEVQDWGVGFEPERFSGDYTRVGLQGMAERVSLIGGRFELRSRPGAGATIHAVFPMVEAPPEE